MGGRVIAKIPHMYLLLVVLFSLIIKLGFLYLIDPFDWGENTKTPEFQKLGGLLVSNNPLEFITKHTTAFAWRTPVYPLFLSVIYRLVGFHVWVVFVLQMLFDTVAVALIYLVCKRLTSKESVAILASLLYSTDPLPLIYTCDIRTESLHASLVVLSISSYILLRKKENGLIMYAVVGSLLGLSSLARPVSLFSPGIIILTEFIYYLRLRCGIVRLLQKISVLVVFYMLVISPWLYRNYSMYGHFSLSTLPGIHLCTWNAAILMTRLEDIQKTGEAAKMLCPDHSDNVFDRSANLAKTGMAYILKHPLQYSRYHLEGMYRMFTETPNTIGHHTWFYFGRVFKGMGFKRDDFAIYPLLFIKIVTFLKNISFILGLYYMLKKPPLLNKSAPLILTVLYFTGATGIIILLNKQVVFGFIRLNLPFLFSYYIIVSYGVISLFQSIIDGLKQSRLWSICRGRTRTFS